MAGAEIEVRGYALIVTMNRPEAMNALNGEVRAGILDGLRRAQQDPEIRAVIITGAGDRAFSAGADLKERAAQNDAGGTQPGAFWDPGDPQLQRGLEFWKPTIAAVNGFALGGGCELAMACDIRVASDRAVFGQPEVTRGAIPGAGGTQRLPRLIPFGVALELLMTGRHIDAQEAHRLGLVNHVVPHEQLLDKAISIAEEIAANAPLAVMAAKEAAYRGREQSLLDGLRLEGLENRIVRASEDAREGPRAFAEKRKPNYRGV
ncbi:MAG: hypothetical protein GEU80_07420 [Dehalococcoidia bacterium]|nr:hypothetical protein [Dehalococcoidia bacterium]